MAYIIGANTVINNNTAIIHSSFELIAGTTQSTEIKVKASDGAAFDEFGQSVAVGSGRIVVGSWQDDDSGSSSGSAYIFNLNGTQLAKIKASDGAADDYFGVSVGVGSGRIVVGSYGDDDNGSDSGSAYIFNLNGTQLAKIKPSDGAAGDLFGATVAAGSGRIFVSSYTDDDSGSNSGSVYIFDLNGTQITKIKPSDGAADDFFGFSVAVGSGRIVVGSYQDDDNGSNSGSAYIFDLSGTQIAKIKASDGAASDGFGYSVAVGSGHIVVGALYDAEPGFGAGSAYIFNLNGTQLAKITASDAAGSDVFGISVGVAGGRIVVGAQGDGGSTGSAYIFNLNGTQLAKITASDGASGDLYAAKVSVGCGRIVIGADGDNDPTFGTDAGSAYIYKLPETSDTYYENVLDTFRY